MIRHQSDKESPHSARQKTFSGCDAVPVFSNNTPPRNSLLLPKAACGPSEISPHEMKLKRYTNETSQELIKAGAELDKLYKGKQ